MDGALYRSLCFTQERLYDETRPAGRLLCFYKYVYTDEKIIITNILSSRYVFVRVQFATQRLKVVQIFWQVVYSGTSI